MRRAAVSIVAVLATVCSTSAWAQLVPAKKAPAEGQKILDIIKKNRGNLVKGPEVTYSVLPQATIFPSLVIASATVRSDESTRPEALLGDIDGRIGVGVSTIGEYIPITVTVTCDQIMEPSTFKGFLPKPHTTYVVMPKIKWKYAELLKSRQQMPVDLTFKVKIGVLQEVEHVETCTLRSLNDCPLAFAAGPIVVDTKWAFAAYVNEDHPWVDGILKEALEAKSVGAFTGYQSKSDVTALQQVYAVWRVLRSRGIRYSDIARVSAENQTLFSQHVRFLDECITNKQANCIDGTVMLASVLRKIGLNTWIVCVPGHAFLAVSLDAEGNNVVGIETTVIGTSRKVADDGTKPLREKLAKLPDFDEASWDNFAAAVKVGSDRLKAELPKLTGQVASTPEYCMISIEDARLAGVRPIPYAPTPRAAPASTPPSNLKRIR